MQLLRFLPASSTRLLFFALSLAGVCSSVPAWSATDVSLPFTTGFEASEGYTSGWLKSNANWDISSNLRVDVVANAFSGSQSLSILGGDWLTLDHALTDSATGYPVSWFDFYLQPIFGAERSLVAPANLNDFSAATGFVKVAAGGEVYALNGNGAGGGVWTPSGFTTAVDSKNRSTGWMRLSYRLDYSTRHWDLYLNGRLVLADLGFLDSSLTEFNRFSLRGDSWTATQLDQFSVGATNPLYTDTSGSGLPDTWLSSYGLSVSFNQRYADPDHDGISNLQEYLLGLNPTNPDTDGDGLPDLRELLRGTDPTVAQIFSLGPIPYAEGFETDVPGPFVDGTRQWSVSLRSDSSVDVIQDTSSSPEGSQFLSLSGHQIHLERLFANPTHAPVVWLDFQAQLAARATPPSNIRADIAAIFYLKTDGWFMAFDGAAWRSLTRLSTHASTTFHRLTVRLDYTAQTWSLWLDGVRQGKDLGFAHPVPYFSGIEVVHNADNAKSAAIDALTVAFTEPALLDNDGDGLTNAQELTLGTNPDLADTDGDGLSDGWEVTYNLNPLEMTDLHVDVDGDGLDTLAEYLAGTDPNNFNIFSATSNVDIGTCLKAGAGTHNATTATYTVTGTGADIGGTSDSFHYYADQLNGDGLIIAHVASMTAYTNSTSATTSISGWAKAGVMIRESLDANSAYAMMMVTPGNGVGMQSRSALGAGSDNTMAASYANFPWIKLERHGNILTGYRSMDGVSWVFSQALLINFPANVYLGLAVTAHTSNASVSAVFDHVAVIHSNKNMALSWPWAESSIGAAGDPGVVTQDVDSYFLSNLGADIWYGADKFKYVSQPLEGDGTITVKVTANSSSDNWTRLGLMMRESLDDNSKNVLVASTRGYGLVFQSRQTTGGSTAFRAASISQGAPVWLRLNRSGNVFTASYSTDAGLTWTVQGSDTVAMATTIQVGLVYSNRSSSTWSFGQAEQLKLTTPLDTDGDGLPDVWEKYYFNGQTGVDTSDDPDQDGLTTAEEWELGTDPMTATPSGEIPVLTVTGGDNQSGLPNAVLPQNLKVVVTNARSGEPISGILVNFRVVAGQGTLGGQQILGIATQASDANGEVQVSFQLPATGGANVIQAWVGDKANVVSLTERALLGDTTTSSVLLDTKDIGTATVPGQVQYSQGTYTFSSVNGDAWGTADSCNYAWQNLAGDGLFVTRVASVDNTDPWAKAGVMIRESLDANASNVRVEVTPGKGVTFQWRTTTGGYSYHATVGGVTAPQWLALRRSGGVVAGYYSSDGHTWTFIGSRPFVANKPVYVGLVHSCHNTASTSYSGRAVFDSVSFSPLAPAPWTVADVGAFNSGNIDDFASDGLHILGGGNDIWGTADSFRYIYQSLPSDGRMVVRVAAQANVNAWAKNGLMVRENASANSRYVLLALTPGNGVSLQARALNGAGAYIVATQAGLTAPTWLKLERFGSSVDGYQSSDGQSWTKVGSVNWGYGASLLGLATASHNPYANTGTLFDNVAQDLFDGSRGWSAVYFDGANFDTQRVAQRDEAVDFQWADGVAPVAGITSSAYSVRWQGVIRPQYSETYTFTVHSNGGVRLWVNGQTVIDDWTTPGAVRDVSGQIALTAGADTQVKLEYFNGGGAGTVQLRWSSASQADQTLPLGSVRPTDTDNDGLPDAWEVANGLNPLNAADAATSTSGDGLSNTFKYQNNLNPSEHYEKRDGLVVVEQWQNIAGNYIANLTSAVAFPTQPTSRWLLKDALEVSNLGDKYGVRIRGYIKAPTTGVYKFWIAGDDESAFWLSPSENPYDRVKVAYSATWTNFRQFDLNATQASKGITLRAGDYYYFEVLQKEGIGGDHVSVAWQVPDSTAGRVLIPLASLASFSIRADTTVPAGALALGTDHSLALFANGNVKGWGGNDYGQLGDGTTADRTSPVNVGYAASVVSISAGKTHSVAVRTDGTLWTWGNNASGQLGDGGTSPMRSARFQVAAFTSNNAAASASAGGGHTLACTAGGQVWAWGDNSKGQLGVDTSIVSQSLPGQVSGLSNVISVAAGDTHSLALKTDGTVWAWGDNADGQLGDGTTVPHVTPVQVAGLSDIVQIAAGTNFSLARKGDGTVWAWGRNDTGQLGDGTLISRSVAVQVSGLTNVWSVCAGDTHALALTSDGAVWGWGSNTKGELGSTLPLMRNVPAPVPSAANGVALGAGNHRSGLVDTTGAVHLWGDNEGGRLGNTTQAYRVSPVGLTDTKQTAFLYAGGNQAFLQRLNGKLFSWGANDHGQLAVGNHEPASTPTPVYDNAVFRNASSIAVGARHTLILTQGMVVAAGDNSVGQLGDGTQTDNIGVWLSVLGADVKAVAAGDRHSLALRSDKTVWAWGSNDQGQLGLGSGGPASSSIPVQVPGLSDVVAIAAGDTHSLALKSDGTVWVWGNNADGQLGDGTAVQKVSPVQVTALKDVKIAAISAGRAHSLFLSAASGTGYSQCVWACGDDTYGQIGNSASGDMLTPALVSTTAVTAIAASGDHNIVLLSNGSILCWGRNDRGQVGNGGTVNRTTPYPITIAYSSANVVAVAANAMASYALLSDGTVAVWGDDSSYQLGYDSGRSVLLPLRLKAWADDADADGLSDVWEAKYSIGSALADSDADGLLNIEEYDRGTDPTMVDTDGDLVSDFADSSLSPLNADSLSVVVLGGDNQVAAPGEFNAAPFDVAFWDADGEAPQTQLPATFTVLNSTGLLSASSSDASGLAKTLALHTDADGTVQAWFRQPETAGENSYVRVRVGAESYDFQTFSASALPVSSDEGRGVSDNPPAPDSDGDGVPDAVEQAMGTDPHDASSTPNVQISSGPNLLLLTP